MLATSEYSYCCGRRSVVSFTTGYCCSPSLLSQVYYWLLLWLALLAQVYYWLLLRSDATVTTPHYKYAGNCSSRSITASG